MNSGRVLAAPMMLNMARNMLHPVRGPRRSKAGLQHEKYIIYLKIKRYIRKKVS